jgi:hypothetical protein
VRINGNDDGRRRLASINLRQVDRVERDAVRLSDFALRRKAWTGRQADDKRVGSAAAKSQEGTERAEFEFKPFVRQRNAPPNTIDDAPDLKSVLSTAELKRRPPRPPDHVAENRALIALAQELATSPQGVLQKLAETALAMCHAHSAGLSLLNDDQKRLHWPVIVGKWACHMGGGTPRDYGPCGTVLDRNARCCFHTLNAISATSPR